MRDGPLWLHALPPDCSKASLGATVAAETAPLHLSNRASEPLDSNTFCLWSFVQTSTLSWHSHQQATVGVQSQGQDTGQSWARTHVAVLPAPAQSSVCELLYLPHFLLPAVN